MRRENTLAIGFSASIFACLVTVIAIFGYAAQASAAAHAVQAAVQVHPSGDHSNHSDDPSAERCVHKGHCGVSAAHAVLTTSLEINLTRSTIAATVVCQLNDGRSEMPLLPPPRSRVL